MEDEEGEMKREWLRVRTAAEYDAHLPLFATSIQYVQVHFARKINKAGDGVGLPKAKLVVVNYTGGGLALHVEGEEMARILNELEIPWVYQ